VNHARIARLQRECEMSQKICSQTLIDQRSRNIQWHSSWNLQKPVYWDHCLFRVTPSEPDYRVTDGEIRDAFSEGFNMAAPSIPGMNVNGALYFPSR
jgi:hypothetical protein